MVAWLTRGIRSAFRLEPATIGDNIVLDIVAIVVSNVLIVKHGILHHSQELAASHTAVMPKISDNIGSAARDFAMLERNLLSHIRLACILLLLSSSLLLQSRIPGPENKTPTTHMTARTALASFQFAASLIAIAAGTWEYRRGYKDMRDMKGFLMATKPHFYVMSVISIVVFASTIVIIVDKNL
ncbi:hypothetical protein BDY19DRAFT_991336 [Irpex rosettiformis]|uniref:Uncharacterized protein n=1 Tax=Irpex rosettiformis TaxID=378272 RepID=A0ACB8UBC7_9APHY|nr:hypothetical protein BDY19DRAFT_991336 [Irpex rosettiformis]